MAMQHQRWRRISHFPTSGEFMFTLYSMQNGGNSYKVRLALALLNIHYRLVDIDIVKGESKTPSFLAMNPSGQVPLLEVSPDRYLAESNAILWYVAIGTLLAPEDRIDRADALQWMFFEQRSLEPHIGAAHFWLTLVKGGRDLHEHSIEDWMDRGYRALRVMEKHLASHDYFAAGHLTVADIALYATTQLAGNCGFDLRDFAALRAWMDRVEKEPGFIPMDWKPEWVESMPTTQRRQPHDVRHDIAAERNCTCVSVAPLSQLPQSRRVRRGEGGRS